MYCLLVAGSGSYIVRLSVRDLHGPTKRTIEYHIIFIFSKSDFINSLSQNTKQVWQLNMIMYVLYLKTSQFLSPYISSSAGSFILLSSFSFFATTVFKLLLV